MSDSATPTDDVADRTDADCIGITAVVRRGNTTRKANWAGVALVALTLAITLGWRHAVVDGAVSAEALIGLVTLQVLAGVIFVGLVAAWIGDVRRACAVGRRAVIAMLVVGAAMRLATLPASTRLEDDHHRYLWDGAVVGIGESPYSRSPQDAMAAAPGTGEAIGMLAREGKRTLSSVNHPHLRTIYPPVAQFWFAVAQRLTPWDVGGWRLVLLLHDLATLVLLLHLLRRLRLPAVLAGIWWINPLVVGEIHQTLHMDVLIVPWVVGAIALAVASRTATASALLAVGTAVKLWPIVLLPLVARGAIGRRWRDGAIGAIGATIVFTVVATALLSPMLLGERGAEPTQSGLMRYAEAWQNNAAFFALHHALWERVLPHIGVEAWWSQQWTRRATVALMAAVVAALVWRPIADGRDLARRAMWIVAALFMLGPTQFPWYFLWVVPLVSIGVDRRGRVCLPLLAFTAMLPLYHLQELAGWTLWLQHLPVWTWLIVDAVGEVRANAKASRSAVVPSGPGMEVAR